MHRYFAAFAAVVLLAGCGGGDKGGTNPPPPVAVATVEISQTAATLKVGDNLTLTATAKSSSGEVLTGRTADWTSSNSSVASVNGGAVTALGPGTTTITVTIEGKKATATITVELPGIATITVSAPRGGFVRVGATTQLTVVLQDASGTTLTGRKVDWSSSDESKATVNTSSGLVTGVAPGTVTITATSEGKTGTVAITVTILPEPTITDISPATLVPGGTATITGTNFSSTPSENTVTVAGVAVTVTAATATQLTITLPADMPCVPTRAHPVVVTTGGGPAVVQHPIQVALPRSLGVGESLVLANAQQARCNELGVSGGRYLLSVFSTSRSPGSHSGFELHGNPDAAIATASAGQLVARTSFMALPLPGPDAMLTNRLDAVRQHLAQLKADQLLMRKLRKQTLAAQHSGRSPATALRSAAGTPPVPPTVGVVTSLRIRKPADQSCSAYDEVRARVVYVGAKSIVLEDTANALAGTIDSDLADLGRTFDDVIMPILTTNFGNPLAYDASLDNNGRILMLFTKRVNEHPAGLLGFVTGCDFFPTSTVAASNQAEIFYASVPTSTQADPFDARTLVGWRGIMKSTVAHEAKHIVSVAERMATPIETDFDDTWLEEGMAQIAAELYARTKYNIRWKENSGYSATACHDIGFSCARGEFLIADHFLFLYNYLRRVETLSYLTAEDASVYGSAWLFLRWVVDQYATDEAAFLRAITQEFDPQRLGVNNVQDKAGVSFAELAGNFSLALIADDYPSFNPPTGARFKIPSWNLPDVFAGFAADLQNFSATPQPIHAIPYGSFAVTVPRLRGGSASFFVLSGSQATPQLLDLRGAGGALLSSTSTVGLAIVRAQ